MILEMIRVGRRCPSSLFKGCVILWIERVAWFNMGPKKKDQDTSSSLVHLLASEMGYVETLPRNEEENHIRKESTPQFEERSYDLTGMKPLRWQLGSQISTLSRSKCPEKDFTKLKHLHERIASQENNLASKTLQRNLWFSSLLSQWFPESLIDQAITELHATDLSKVMADEKVLCRILGYLEALLRISCRTIPWQTLQEINDELGFNIDKNKVATAKFKAIQCGAFKSFYQNRGNTDTFDVIRFQIGRLIAKLDVIPSHKKVILDFSQRLCAFLEQKQQIPKDPEIYGHAIVEIACKRILKSRNLRTVQDARLKKKISTAIHYIRKQCRKK